MSRLTVTEKEHWKSRIERRIDKAIERLEATDKNFMPSLRARAEAAAYDALGVTEEYTNLNRLKKQYESLKGNVEQAEVELHMKGLGLGGNPDKPDYMLRNEFHSLLTKQIRLIEEKLLGDSELGQWIATLRLEKESLLDTVWLATSSVQIRDLWARVSAVLGDDSTGLQQQLLNAGDTQAEREA